MFKIGPFSDLARVSVRQLRFYDEIGLLSPAYVDQDSGYRYYQASQLQRVNEILALKRLGLSLEEVGKVLAEPADVGELRELLRQRREEAQALIAKQEAQFREIDARLRQLERRGSLEDYDLVLKPGLKQWLASFTRRYDGIADVLSTAQAFARAARRQLPRSAVQHLLVAYPDEGFSLEDANLEMGILLSKPIRKPITMDDGTQTTLAAIEDSDTLLTMVRAGTPDLAYVAANAMGHWVEQEGYEISGPMREVLLNIEEFLNGRPVVEMQLPVRGPAPPAPGP